MCERVKYSTIIDKDLIKKLKLAAVEENKTANLIIEEALRNYLNKASDTK